MLSAPSMASDMYISRIGRAGLAAVNVMLGALSLMQSPGLFTIAVDAAALQTQPICPEPRAAAHMI